MNKFVAIIPLLTLVFQSFNINLDKTPYFDKKITGSENPVLKQITNGKQIYNKTCVACHQMNGKGIQGAFPALAKSEFLNDNVNNVIQKVIVGSTKSNTSDGKKYIIPMPKQLLSDQQIADVLTYIYANWDNNKAVVTIDMVKAVRK